MELAGGQEAREGQLGEPATFRGQVNLRQAPVGQGDVDLDKEVEAGEGAAAKTGPGQHGAGDGVPNEALLFGDGAPTGGDRAESPADGDLSGGAGVGGDEGRVADLAVASALPDRCLRICPIWSRTFSTVTTIGGCSWKPSDRSLRRRTGRGGRQELVKILILLKNPGYFLVLREGGGASNRLSRRSERSNNCHWTCSPASKSRAAAKGKGTLTKNRGGRRLERMT